MASNHQKVGENYGTDSSLELLEGINSTDTLILGI